MPRAFNRNEGKTLWRGEGSRIAERLHKRSAEDAKATCGVLDPEGEGPFRNASAGVRAPKAVPEGRKRERTAGARDGAAGTARKPVAS